VVLGRAVKIVSATFDPSIANQSERQLHLTKSYPVFSAIGSRRGLTKTWVWDSVINVTRKVENRKSPSKLGVRYRWIKFLAA